jgi:hypothetical protein
VTHPHYGHSPTYIRPSPAVGVKIATQKVPISTLTTGYLKNTPTIISIPFFIFFHFSLSLSSLPQPPSAVAKGQPFPNLKTKPFPTKKLQKSKN